MGTGKKKWQLISLVLVFLLVAYVPVYAAGEQQGIDVSSYNNTVDWIQVKNQGKSFVMIRTGVGLDTGADDSDTQFAANYAGAGAAGLKRGVYHVAWRTTAAEAKAEAQYCLKILNGRKLEYPVAYDIEREEIFQTGKANVTKMAKTFCDTVRAAGYTPMIYSSSFYLNTYFDWSQLGDVKVWVADYSSSPSFRGTYHIWQYSSTGMVAGANTEEGVCDLNLSYLEARKVKLNQITKKMGLKEKFTLTASIVPKQSWDSVTFTSSDKSVAKVNAKGVVTAQKAGKATIMVKAGNAVAACEITVKNPTGIQLPRKKVTLKAGKSYKIQPTTKNNVYCYKYTYSSNKKRVAKVNAKGKIQALKKGKAVITVKTYNGKKAKLKVTVK